MTKLQKKLNRPRIGSTLCLSANQIKELFGEEKEIFVSENVSYDFSPRNYFRIMKYQMEHSFKNKDTNRMLDKSFTHVAAKRIHNLRLMRDAHKLHQEFGKYTSLLTSKTL